MSEELTGERVVDARATLLLDWLRETLPARSQWREVPNIQDLAALYRPGDPKERK